MEAAEAGHALQPACGALGSAGTASSTAVSPSCAQCASWQICGPLSNGSGSWWAVSCADRRLVLSMVKGGYPQLGRHAFVKRWCHRRGLCTLNGPVIHCIVHAATTARVALNGWHTYPFPVESKCVRAALSNRSSMCLPACQPLAAYVRLTSQEPSSS